MSRRSRSLVSTFACLVLAACSAKGGEGGAITPSGDGGPGDPGPASGDGAVGGDDSSLGKGEAGKPVTGEGKTLLYAHSPSKLYTVDPTDPKLAITLVGAFDCVDPNPTGDMVNQLTDLAVDRNGKLYGVGKSIVYLDMQVTGNKVACKGRGKPISDTQTVYYGATFAPAGALGPNETLIIANTAGELKAVDTTTGALTLVGNLGAVPKNDGRGHSYDTTHVGNPWALSGDIVFLENKGSPVGFATVRDCNGTNCGKIDTLLEIDVSKLSATSPGDVTRRVRGQIVKDASCNDPANTGYGSMFGIVAYKGDIIGFSNDGSVVRINNDTGAACLIADDSTVESGFRFYGAGVTTIVDVVAPPK